MSDVHLCNCWWSKCGFFRPKKITKKFTSTALRAGHRGPPQNRTRRKQQWHGEKGTRHVPDLGHFKLLIPISYEKTKKNNHWMVFPAPGSGSCYLKRSAKMYTVQKHGMWSFNQTKWQQSASVKKELGAVSRHLFWHKNHTHSLASHCHLTESQLEQEAVAFNLARSQLHEDFVMIHALVDLVASLKSVSHFCDSA